LYEFSPRFIAEGRRTGIEPLNLVIFHIMHHFSLRYLCDVWPFGICIIMKALNGFLVIQKQVTLKV